MKIIEYFKKRVWWQKSSWNKYISFFLFFLRKYLNQEPTWIPHIDDFDIDKNLIEETNAL